MLYPIRATDPALTCPLKAPPLVKLARLVPIAWHPALHSIAAAPAPVMHMAGFKSDLALAMQRMGTAVGTELLDSEFIGLPLLVLGGGVVATFATVARQTD
jgi:hypothetical protein